MRFSSFAKKEKYDRCISLLLPKTEKYVHRISLFLKKTEKYVSVFMYSDKKRHCFASTLSLFTMTGGGVDEAARRVVSEFGFWTSTFK